ncbi:hypothetical protein B0T21DRAFT_423852 [Apiosordaria backusii]|uniref:Uncharacterized protein n=1 Tax=Apiosordaria backusii TaxID=314023 RepID=A0AA40DZE6_9PEZI|nr:hypothetical protein B0T21DRAFT_423852 [Apiosordaria backusii]
MAADAGRLSGRPAIATEGSVEALSLIRIPLSNGLRPPAAAWNAGSQEVGSMQAATVVAALIQVFGLAVACALCSGRCGWPSPGPMPRHQFPGIHSVPALVDETIERTVHETLGKGGKLSVGCLPFKATSHQLVKRRRRRSKISWFVTVAMQDDDGGQHLSDTVVYPSPLLIQRFISERKIEEKVARRAWGFYTCKFRSAGLQTLDITQSHVAGGYQLVVETTAAAKVFRGEGKCRCMSTVKAYEWKTRTRRRDSHRKFNLPGHPPEGPSVVSTGSFGLTCLNPERLGDIGTESHANLQAENLAIRIQMERGLQVPHKWAIKDRFEPWSPDYNAIESEG